MEIDGDTCYEAMRSRDRRFDGRFFVAVRTTGIYCRPICPSRLPLRRNVDFYAHPAAAEDAGFRACRRCRPDTAPGSTAWRGGSAVVDRALRLIDTGALDNGSVGQLAARLHVGDRHLRRLFVTHLGTSPDAVARSRRAHLARRLIEDTDLPITDVAFAAGFGSVRQHNDVVRAAFGATPTELRAGRRGPAGDGAVSIRIPVRQPFDLDPMLDWFASRAVAGVEQVDEHGYHRRFRLDGGAGSFSVSPAGVGGLRLEVELEADAAHRSLGEVVGRVRRLFDTDADVDAIAEHLGTDPLLAGSVSADPGLRVPGAVSGFEAAVRAIVHQQISVAGGRTILGRIVERVSPGRFPDAADLVDADLAGLGMTTSRVDALRAMASATLAGDVHLDGSSAHPDLVADLCRIVGIGPWTAEYIALRLGEPDAFPAGDLHLRRRMGITGTGAASTRAAEARAAAWRPWRGYAALHLWHSISPESA